MKKKHCSFVFDKQLFDQFQMAATVRGAPSITSLFVAFMQEYVEPLSSPALSLGSQNFFDTRHTGAADENELIAIYDAIAKKKKK